MFSADNARERYRGIQDGLKGDAAAAPAVAAAAPANRAVKKADPGKPIRLAFVTNNPSEFWKLASNGVKKYVDEAAARGEKVTVDVKMPQNGTVAEQNQILEDLVAQGYDGIAISVIAPDAQVPEIDRAAAKTNVICHDSDAPKSKRLVYIGTNNYEAGKRLGQQIRAMKLLPDGAVNLLQPKEDNKDTKAAQTNVEDVLTGQSDVKLLIGLWSYNGPAIADALGSSPRKAEVKAAVFDEEEGTLDAIEKGTIQCTVVQKPYQFGYQSSKLLHELAMKGESALPKSDTIDTGVEVITSGPTSDKTKNVAQFRKELAEQKK
jgi:ribose transport system substrate-binding protein